MLDCGQDTYCWDYSVEDQDAPQHAKDIWGNYLYDTNGAIIINGPDYGEGDGFKTVFEMLDRSCDAIVGKL